MAKIKRQDHFRIYFGDEETTQDWKESGVVPDSVKEQQHLIVKKSFLRSAFLAVCKDDGRPGLSTIYWTKMKPQTGMSFPGALFATDGHHAVVVGTDTYPEPGIAFHWKDLVGVKWSKRSDADIVVREWGSSDMPDWGQIWPMGNSNVLINIGATTAKALAKIRGGARSVRQRHVSVLAHEGVVYYREGPRANPTWHEAHDSESVQDKSVGFNAGYVGAAARMWENGFLMCGEAPLSAYLSMSDDCERCRFLIMPMRLDNTEVDAIVENARE